MQPFPPPQQRIFHRARAEGRVHEMSALDKLLYAAKYLFAHQKQASPEIAEHFAAQKKILASLPAPHGPTVKLGFLGDIMWIKNGWGSFLGADVLGHLQEFHGIVGNLESVVSENLPVPEFFPDYFTYNSDPRLVTSFRGDSGSLFAALSFANNHALDRSDQGALDTLALLEREKIPQSGISAKGAPTWATFSRGGIEFGFYAATFGLNEKKLLEETKLQLNWLPNLSPDRVGPEPDLSGPISALEEMKKKGVGIKILYLHWGHEFEFFPTARQMQVARELVKAGADIIVGSHPHVAQPSEILWVNGEEKSAPLPHFVPGSCLLEDGRGIKRKALVMYSLGNFANAMFTFQCRVAQTKVVQFFRKPDGRVDWWGPQTQLFYNQPTGKGFRLVSIREFLASPPGRKKRNHRHLKFLLDHLGEPRLTEEIDQELSKF